MGILIVKAYRTSMFAKLADHTYVECEGGARAWRCWGGKTGGRQLRRGTGSTKRANCIARPNEKAGIKCYLVNGVCHQAANRILITAGITVRGARGYSISHALFGPYGRVGFWPCKSPFKQCPSVTGDLSGCIPTKAQLAGAKTRALGEADKLDWQYIRSVLDLYRDAEGLMTTKASSSREAESFHVRLFTHMAEFELGPALTRPYSRALARVRRGIEKELLAAQRAFTRDAMSAEAYVKEIDALTIRFQDEMANVMDAGQYKTLFDLEPGDTVTLSDPRIIEEVHGFKMER